MPYKIGTATGHEDLLEQFRKWVCGHGTNASAVADPGNVGNGTVDSIITTQSTVTETITIVCTDATAPATFTVSGSVSGVFGTTATAGVAYLNSKIGFTITAGGTAFALDDTYTIDTTVGDMTDAAMQWIEQTPTAQSNKKTVVYARSGSTYTVYLPYHDLGVNEQIGVEFVTTGTSNNGDYAVASKNSETTAGAYITFTGPTTYGGGTAMPTSGTMIVTYKETHLFLKGRGNGGTDEIFVQLRTYKNVGAGYYNLELRGATGFDISATDRLVQSGISGLVDMALTAAAMDYWFVANGRRFVIICKNGTYYDACYAGFILTTGLPSEWPYPLCIGGSSTTKKTTNGTAGTARSMFWDPQTANAYICEKNGNWLTFINSDTYAYKTTKIHPNAWTFSNATGGNSTLFPNLYNGAIDPVNSGFQLFAFSLMSRRTGTPDTHDIFGDLQGCFKISGHNNAGGNTVTISGVTHLVIPNVWRATKYDYAAIALE